MKKLNITDNVDIYSEYWTEENQDNFDSLLVAAEMLNYKVHSFSGAYADQKPDHYTFSFTKNKANIIYLSFQLKDTFLTGVQVIEFSTTHSFGKNFDRTINYAKTLL